MKSLLALVLSTAGTAAVFVALAMLGIELTRHQIEIQPISAPKSLAEAGYSPEVAAVRLRDAIDRLAEDAANAGGRSLTISMHGDMPDIVVPTVGLSVSTLAVYLQHFFGYASRTTIGGELTLSEQRVSLLLRLNGEVIFRSREPVTMDRLDGIWAQAAETVMLEISPYRAVLALYNASPEAAMHLADSIIQRYPPNDENVAWARLVRGLGHLNSFRYRAAEQQFRDILRQANDGGLMPYLNPFATPSYVEPAHFYLGLSLLYQGQAAEAYPELRRAVRLEEDDPGAHYSLGKALQDLGKTAEANAQFTATWRIYHRLLTKRHGPKSARVHVAFGQLLLEQNKEQEALAQLNWAVELDPSDYARGNLCNGLRQAKRLDDALRECIEAARLAPRRVENQISLATLLLDRNNLDGARKAAEEARWLAPESPVVRQLLGSVYKKAEQFDQAGAEYREAIRLAPEVGVFYSDLGSLLVDQMSFADAAEQFRSAIALSPRDAALRSNLADALDRQKDIDGAIREYKAALDLDAGQANWYNALGNLYLEKQDSAAAVDSYGKAIALAPRVAVIHSNLANALARHKAIDGAIREYKTALGLDAGQAVWYNALGNLYLEKQDSAAAVDSYGKAIALAPRDAVMHSNLANALDRQKDIDGAIREYKEALGLDAGRADWYNALGSLYLKKRDFAAAVDPYKAAVALAPLDAAIRRNLAGTLLEQQRFDAAIDEFRKAIALTPADGMAQTGLGLALLGRTPLDPEALSAFRAAIALNPKDPAPYAHLAFALGGLADSAESEALRIDLLAQACQVLTDGLIQAPGNPYLRQELTSIAPRLPPYASCEAITGAPRPR